MKVIDIYGGPADGFQFEHRSPPKTIAIKMEAVAESGIPIPNFNGTEETYHLIFKGDKPYYVHNQINIGQWLNQE